MAITRSLRRTRTPTTTSLAVADAITTATFVLFSSLWGEAAARLAASTSLSPFQAGLAVLAAGLALFDPVARLVGRVATPGTGNVPCFNPAHSLALAVASAGAVVKGKATSFSAPLRAAAVRSAAQVAGGLAAALAAASALPKTLQKSLPAPTVDAARSSLKAAFVAEAVLGGVLALVVIWASSSSSKGVAKSRLVAVGAPLLSTVALTVVGSELAAHAPAFNPAVAAAWSWRPSLSKSSSSLLEHAAAFWVAPLVGAATAGVVWRIVQEEDKRSSSSSSSSSTGRAAGRARASAAKRR